ncbi:MAG: UrcA family protein [Pseudomonadota bacterium]
MRHIVIASALLAAVAAAPAGADTPVYRLHVADLDLASRDGRATLDHRIGRALEALCGSYATVAPADAGEIDQCRAATRARIDRALATLPGAAALAAR